MSKNLMQILELENKAKLCRWFSASVEVEGAVYEYFIPYFSYIPDILDHERSKFVHGRFGNMLVKAFLDRQKIQGMGFFSLPDSEIRIVISEQMKLSIEAAKLDGIDFSVVPIV